MPIHTPGQTEGAIHHTGIGPDTLAAAPVEVAMRAPQSSVEKPSRRGFLGRAFGMAGALSMLGITEEAWSKTMLDEVMDKIDDMFYIKDEEREDKEREPNLGKFNEGIKRPTVREINDYIAYIKARAKRENKGVHMQEHENVMWLIAYFKAMKNMDKDILYYPAKTGAQSKYVASFLRDPKNSGHRKIIKKAKSYYVKEEVDIHIDDRKEIVEVTNEERAVLAFIDIGWSYCILPKGTPIISFEDVNEIGQKKAMIGACRNPIAYTLSECPQPK